MRAEGRGGHGGGHGGRPFNGSGRPGPSSGLHRDGRMQKRSKPSRAERSLEAEASGWSLQLQALRGRTEPQPGGRRRGSVPQLALPSQPRAGRGCALGRAPRRPAYSVSTQQHRGRYNNRSEKELRRARPGAGDRCAPLERVLTNLHRVRAKRGVKAQGACLIFPRRRMGRSPAERARRNRRGPLVHGPPLSARITLAGALHLGPARRHRAAAIRATPSAPAKRTYLHSTRLERPICHFGGLDADASLSCGPSRCMTTVTPVTGRLAKAAKATRRCSDTQCSACHSDTDTR